MSLSLFVAIQFPSEVKRSLEEKVETNSRNEEGLEKNDLRQTFHVVLESRFLSSGLRFSPGKKNLLCDEKTGTSYTKEKRKHYLAVVVRLKE